MYLKKPKNTLNEVNSRDALKYLWLNWRLIGMHPTVKNRLAYYIYSLLINITFTLFMPILVIVNVQFIRNLEELVGNLSFSMTIIMVSFKITTTFFYRRSLLRTDFYLEKLDVRCNQYATDRLFILHAMRICHIFYLSHMCLYGINTLGNAFIGLKAHILLYSRYFPTVLKNAEANFYLGFIYQNLAVTLAVPQNVNGDIYPQSYVTVMIGHIRALKARIERIGKQGDQGAKANLKELMECVKDHKNILNYFACIRPVISRTVFLQFLITAAVLCLTAFNFIAFERDATSVLFSATYLVAVSIEILPCCWFMNSLMEESASITTSLYNCNWYDQSLKFRKMLLIFMTNTQKPMTILAGNLVPISLQSFVAVIRFSFSLYTLLNNINDTGN